MVVALLPTTTVRESVALIAAVHRSPLTVAEALRRARCSEIAGQKVAKLSGGETQRARFAVAIVSNPELLLLDEPTAAMDVEARRTFWESMHEYTDEGRTVVFATRYLDEAGTFADRIVMLRGGCVVADGAPAQVKAIVSGRRIRATLPGLGRRMPSYGLNHLGDMSARLSSDAMQPVLVLLAWTIALAVFISWRYRRDAARA